MLKNAPEIEFDSLRVKLELPDGSKLDKLIFNHIEHRWIFENYFSFPEQRQLGENPELVNTTKLVINYENGIAKDCDLSMDIIMPNKRGKTYFVGVDISKDSHLFAQFKYEKQNGLYKLKLIDLGMHGRVDLDSLEGGLMPSGEGQFPFPLLDPVINEQGVYKIPFLKSNSEEAFFEFPENYRKRF